MKEAGGERVRKLGLGDIPAAFQLSAQAGWNQTEDDWRSLLELSPEGCLGIEVGSHLAATTTLLCYGRQLAWIGMVLTEPKYQRRGFARRLLTKALEQAKQMGIETIKLDATDQGLALYKTLGFGCEQEIERWSKPGGDALQLPAGEISQARPWQASDLQIFGADRSHLLNRLARLHRAISTSQSYLFSRPGRVSAYLGPWVSENPVTARRLIERCLHSTNCSWSWDLFPRNQNAVALARDLGFSVQRHLVRMARGKQLQQQTDAIYAIAGFELG